VTSTPARSLSAPAIHTITEPWEWQCGFYPGSRPGEFTSGTADEAAWKVFLSNRAEADFQAWRDQEAWMVVATRALAGILLAIFGS
jgi:hypothetical protein